MREGQGIAKSFDAIPIHFEAEGDGTPALVFVHGWSCDRRYWKAQMDAFAPTYRVVSIDLAGHGDSGSGRGSWTMTAFGADVVAVVELLRLDDVVLVGHSMGGDVIVEAAHQLGDRVRGLVWADTYGRLGAPRTEAQLAAIIDPLRADFTGRCELMVRGMFLADADPNLVAFVATDMSAAAPDVAIDAVAHAIGNDALIVSRLADLGVPVIAINGDYIQTDLASLERHGVEAVILSGLGHFPMMEDPVRFNAALSQAVRGLLTPAS